MSSGSGHHRRGETLAAMVASSLGVSLLSLAMLTAFQVQVARRRSSRSPWELGDGRGGVGREVDTLPVQTRRGRQLGSAAPSTSSVAPSPGRGPVMSRRTWALSS